MENNRQNSQLPLFPVGRTDQNVFLVPNHPPQMEHNEVVGDVISVTSHDDELSDSESGTDSASTARSEEFGFLSRKGMIRLEEMGKDFDIIRRKFIMGMGPLAKDTTVVAVYKNSHSSLTGQARLQSFHIHKVAMYRKCGGVANIKHAWYGGNVDEIGKIISYGFGQYGSQNNGLFGSGIYLSPENFSIDSAMNSNFDENGLRHVLLCRVILGNVEEVCLGSKQFNPSSEQFDSGVDRILGPRKYIIWPTHMNTHIVPDYVISFRAPMNFEGFKAPLRKPKSPWIPFTVLMSILSRCLPPASMNAINKYHNDFVKNKLPRQYLVQRLRQIAGDKLLSAIIKSCMRKEANATTGSSPSSIAN